jgi:Na+:H+ antiporter, NhaA family
MTLTPDPGRRDDAAPNRPTFGAVLRPLQEFLRTEAAGGVVLLLCAVAALAWANLSPASYAAVFEYPFRIGAGTSDTGFTARELINDGLMAFFFFVVGMEIKRELVLGELDTPAKATLPAVAALGGMVLPAAIFVAFNWGGPGLRGWGIPMATDIAFCVGLLALLGDRVPRGLVVFVTALAIFDDIGGILVIAFFYGHGFQAEWLVAAAVITIALVAINRAYVTTAAVYGLAGLGLWVCLHHGGIHATIAGVVLGMMVPARPRRASREIMRELAAHAARLDATPPDAELDAAQLHMIEEEIEDLEPPVNRFIHTLHPFVAFGVMPAFALANTGVNLRGFSLADLTAPVALGTAAGLVVGKTIGIFGLSWVAVRFGLAPMPGGARSSQLLGVSVVAGIGFTVALFIATLAYAGAPDLLAPAKLGIVIGSLTAGLLGFVLLRFTSDASSRAVSPSQPTRVP